MTYSNFLCLRVSDLERGGWALTLRADPGGLHQQCWLCWWAGPVLCLLLLGWAVESPQSLPAGPTGHTPEEKIDMATKLTVWTWREHSALHVQNISIQRTVRLFESLSRGTHIWTGTEQTLSAMCFLKEDNLCTGVLNHQNTADKPVSWASLQLNLHKSTCTVIRRS